MTLFKYEHNGQLFQVFSSQDDQEMAIELIEQAIGESISPDYFEAIPDWEGTVLVQG